MNAKKKELDLTRPVILAINLTRSQWGRSNDLAEAMKTASIRRSDRWLCALIENIDRHPLTKDDFDATKNGGVVMEGWKIGDLYPPRCVSTGVMDYRGRLLWLKARA